MDPKNLPENYLCELCEPRYVGGGGRKVEGGVGKGGGECREVGV